MKCCKRCNSNIKVEEHNVHCKFMDNPKGFGITINLCKNCHTILGLIIPSIIWKYVPEKDKLKAIKEVESFSLNSFCCVNKNKKIDDFEDVGKYCGNDDCCFELDEEDIIEGICPYCLKSIIKGDCDYGYKYY